MIPEFNCNSNMESASLKRRMSTKAIKFDATLPHLSLYHIDGSFPDRLSIHLNWCVHKIWKLQQKTYSQHLPCSRLSIQMINTLRSNGPRSKIIAWFVISMPHKVSVVILGGFLLVQDLPTSVARWEFGNHSDHRRFSSCYQDNRHGGGFAPWFLSCFLHQSKYLPKEWWHSMVGDNLLP